MDIPELGFSIDLGEVVLTECETVNQFTGSRTEPPQFTRGYGLVFGQTERKAISMALVDRALRWEELGEDNVGAPAQDAEFVLYHSDNVQATGFLEHIKLPHYVDFQSELELIRRLRAEAHGRDPPGGRGMTLVAAAIPSAVAIAVPVAGIALVEKAECLLAAMMAERPSSSAKSAPTAMMIQVSDMSCLLWLRDLPGRNRQFDGGRAALQDAADTRNQAPDGREHEAAMTEPAYNFAYLDEQTKRMIRRAILKGVAVPGYQVPFASREMPMPYGWGTGGVQVTAACLTPDDTLKVIDQGADDTTNAVSIRKFFAKTAGVAVTSGPGGHDHPDPPPHSRDAADRGQILVYQVPIPEPLRFLEPSRGRDPQDACARGIRPDACEALRGHRPHGEIATAYAYPVSVEDRYVMDPSPIPKFDNPKLKAPRRCSFSARAGAADLCRAAHTEVVSLDFEDHPFEIQAPHPCALCGAEDTYLDEVITDDEGGRMFVCSDTDFCAQRREDAA
jgi:alpha-D-ribose 1-methylphosphonate 5-phosphate C-P lyase